MLSAQVMLVSLLVRVMLSAQVMLVLLLVRVMLSAQVMLVLLLVRVMLSELVILTMNNHRLLYLCYIPIKGRKSLPKYLLKKITAKTFLLFSQRPHPFKNFNTKKINTSKLLMLIQYAKYTKLYL
jgi:hypothetical protein